MEKEINQLVEFVLDEICTGGDNGESIFRSDLHHFEVQECYRSEI